MDYDPLAPAFARNRTAYPHIVARLAAGLGPGARVLELGCGTKNHLLALAADVGCGAVGLDPSERMLAVARAREGLSVWVAGRAEQLPFAGSSFDLVFSVDVIHHIADQAASFREAWRSLAPGGRICTVTQSTAQLRAMDSVLRACFPETAEIDVARYPTVATLRAQMTAAGFASPSEEELVTEALVEDPRRYAERAYSSLHLISEEAFAAGLARVTERLRHGPAVSVRRQLLLWGLKPAATRS